MQPPVLTPDTQSALDHAYWHTTRSIADVRTEFGLTAAQVNKLVTPLPKGVDCWICGAAQVFRSRTERNDAQRPYGQHARCQCGAKQPHVPDATDLVDTDAAIVAPLFVRRDPWSCGYSGRRDERRERMHAASDIVCASVESMARSGMRWNGRFTTVDANTTPDELITRLEALPTRVLVVPSLTDLMSNEGDSLTVFFRLVARGWRVLTAGRSSLQGGVYEGWCDDLAQPWQRTAIDHPERGLRLVRGRP